MTRDGVNASARVTGELDHATAPALQTVLDELVADGCTHIELDLVALRFMGAAGVHVMLRTEEALGGPGRIWVAHPPPTVAKVLAAASLLRLTEPGCSDRTPNEHQSDGRGSARPETWSPGSANPAPAEVVPGRPERSEERQGPWSETLAALPAQLQLALERRFVIEQAKGVLIARTGCAPDAALGLLVAQSQHENRKLREIASELVHRNVRPLGDAAARRPTAKEVDLRGPD